MNVSMIDFVVVSLDLRPGLDTWVKRLMDLSNDHHQVVCYLQWWGKMPMRTGRPKELLSVCFWQNQAWEVASTLTTNRALPTSSWTLPKSQDTDSTWTMVHAFIVTDWRCGCKMSVVTATPEVIDRHPLKESDWPVRHWRQIIGMCSPRLIQLCRFWVENFGEEHFLTTLNKFWSNVPSLNTVHSGDGELLTLTGEIGGENTDTTPSIPPTVHPIQWGHNIWNLWGRLFDFCVWNHRGG